MTNIKIVDSEDKEVKPQVEAHSDPMGQTMVGGEILTQNIATLFDLKPNEIPRYQSKLQTLIDYAKTKTDNHSLEGLKWAIRNLSLKVGTPPLGEKLINYLTRYAYLALEKGKIDKELNNFTYGVDN